jgi:hypothetical protein
VRGVPEVQPEDRRLPGAHLRQLQMRDRQHGVLLCQPALLELQEGLQLQLPTRLRLYRRTPLFGREGVREKMPLAVTARSRAVETAEDVPAARDRGRAVGDVPERDAPAAVVTT